MDELRRAAIAASNLRSLPVPVRDRLLATGVARTVDAGAILRREGDDTAHLALVLSGLLRVFVSDDDGRTMTVRYVRSGDLLGAASLFKPTFMLPGTIQSVTDAEVLQLDAAAVRHAADTDVVVARALIDELSDRVVEFVEELPGSAFATIRERVARHLLDLAVTVGRDLVAQVPQQALADAVGTSREVVVRCLRELRESGLIRTGRDGIAILDAESMAAEAGRQHERRNTGS